MASQIQVSPKWRRNACFPPLLRPKYYDLEPSLAQTIMPKVSSANISKAKKFLRPEVEILLANPKMSIADHCSVEANPFDVGVHIDSVKCGLRFPLHPFMSEFFNAHEIIPAQLAPNGYRFFVVFLNVCEECHIPPSLNLFHYLFNVEPAIASENRGFVTISARRGFKFVTDFPSNRMGWKKKFFKVRVPPSQISFHNVWATRMMCFPTPTETPELKSQVEEITRFSRSCKVYGSQERIDILYGFIAAPVVPLPHIDNSLVPIHQAPMPIKVEAVEANHVAPPPGFEIVGEMREKIKDLEAQLFFARQAGVDDFKKSQEFEQSALEYIHNNLEAFVNWELCDESRKKSFFRALNANPTWRAKKIRDELETDDYFKRKWELQKSIYDYERLMVEFDGINANRLKIPRNLAAMDVSSSSTPPALDH
nr:uncharacterized protein LOC109173927 [Ipomoea trifida]